jgi:hypothetical protein
MRRALPFAAALLALTLAGCQKSLEKKEARTEARVCADLAAVGTALEQVAALEPTSTVGQATAANQALATAITSLERSQADLERLRLRDFQTQLKAFDREARRITTNKKLTLEEAAAELKAKARPVIEARQRVSAQVKCEAAAATPGKTP